MEGPQRGHPLWVGQSSCFSCELQLLTVFCLGTPLCLFYLPWHKKRFKLILSFKQLQNWRGEKNLDLFFFLEKKKRFYNRGVFINSPQPSTTACYWLYLVWSFTPNQSISLLILIYFSSWAALVNADVKCIVGVQVLCVEGWVWVGASVVGTKEFDNIK